MWYFTSMYVYIYVCISLSEPINVVTHSTSFCHDFLYPHHGFRQKMEMSQSVKAHHLTRSLEDRGGVDGAGHSSYQGEDEFIQENLCE